MFSHDKLINLVFINEDDYFFSESMLMMSPRQYLWLRLRKGGYRKVFFLDLVYGNLRVSTLEDGVITPVKKLFSKKTDVGKWMTQHLKSEKEAIVCPLHDFDRVFSQDDWAGILRNLLSLTTERCMGLLVLTASPYAEETTPLLLTSPVFDMVEGKSLCREITLMRTAPETELYPALSKAMGESCIFLNRYSRTAIRSLLQMLYMKRGMIKPKEITLEQLASHILHYLEHPDKRADYRLLPYTPSFLQIYQWLNDEDTMNGMIHGAMAEKDEEDSFFPRIYVFYRPGSIFERCLRLKIPFRLREQEQALVAKLSTIQQSLISPHNRLANNKVLDKVERIIDLLSLNDPNDIESERRGINALEFGVYNLYADSGEKEDDIVNILESMLYNIGQSVNYYILRRERSLIPQAKSNPLSEKKAKQLDQQLLIFQKQLEQYDTIISASALNASLKDVLHRLDNLDIDKGDQKHDRTPVVHTTKLSSTEDDVLPLDMYY